MRAPQTNAITVESVFQRANSYGRVNVCLVTVAIGVKTLIPPNPQPKHQPKLQPKHQPKHQLKHQLRHQLKLQPPLLLQLKLQPRLQPPPKLLPKLPTHATQHHAKTAVLAFHQANSSIPANVYPVSLDSAVKTLSPPKPQLPLQLQHQSTTAPYTQWT